MTSYERILLFLLRCHGDHRDLHSFPTRRSSDLDLGALCYNSCVMIDTFLVPEKTAVKAKGDGPAVEVSAASRDRKSTRLNSSHRCISYAVFCLKKKIIRTGLGKINKEPSSDVKG